MEKIYMAAGSFAFELPVLPESLSITVPGANERFDTAESYQGTLFKWHKNRQLTLKGVFPGEGDPYVENGYSPEYYVNAIQGWMEAFTPVKLNWTGGAIDVYMTVTVENFTYTEEGGMPGTLSYEMDLVEYRKLAAPQVNTGSLSLEIQNALTAELGANTSGITGSVTGEGGSGSGSTAAPPREDNRTIPETYTLVKGDCLWSIARRFYGDGTKYKAIQTLNNIPNSKLNSLPIGLVIRLP
ncbi:LysM peptidoglycan-binding domain-containing protein [Gehongia tenuis]|uniref:LysM peptidoglycan-binding domain-containing protein n=1 Tax=Gehongia tenuis TaxID=2763655 RepID=A0A926D326_9FIRM|nr:LysM peptidoglycan-binding domain-containing protein [Gehongia tenuis]MBC8530574.1 LysM peptidoglycan-binding domain-containing protein [Gehongia tenuis]